MCSVMLAGPASEVTCRIQQMWFPGEYTADSLQRGLLWAGELAGGAINSSLRENKAVWLNPPNAILRESEK